MMAFLPQYWKCVSPDRHRIVVRNRGLNIVHFRRNKSDPDRRVNFDPFPHAEGDQDCTDWGCVE